MIRHFVQIKYAYPRTLAVAEFDAYTRFKAMAVTGNPEAGLRILDKLDNLTE